MNDDSTSGAPTPGSPRKRTVAVAAAVGVAGLVAGGLAAGAISSASASTDGNGPGVRPGYGAPWGYGGPGAFGGEGGPGRPGHPRGDHQEVTGATRTKVVAAVQAKYPDATVRHVVKDPDGGYEAHATDDGKPLVVLVSKAFEVTGTRTPPPGGPGRHGGRPPGGGPGAKGDGEHPAPPHGVRPTPPKDAPGSAEGTA